MVGIITFNADTFSNPTLYSLIKKLNEQKIKVCIFCPHQDAPIPEELSLTTYFDLPKGLKLPRRPNNIFDYLLTFYRVIRHIQKNKINSLIGVDPFGFVMAGRVRKFVKNAKLHYCSFEIFFNTELQEHPEVLKVKKQEIYYCQQVSSIVVQDEVRMRLLARENKIPKDTKWHLIPVSPTFERFDSKKDYKLALGFSPNDKVYVHSGSVAEWSGIETIIDAIERGLPSGSFILIHSRSPFNNEDPYHEKLAQLVKEGYPVVLHDSHFNSYTEYCAFLASFDYGIALYKTSTGFYTGLNLQEIGLASGKFSTYMLLGLPTILFNCETYHDILQDYPIGAVANEAKDLHFHIKNGSLNHIKKEDCIAFYHKVLNPEKPIGILVKELLVNA